MMSGGMMGGFGMGYGIFGFFMMLLFWILVIVGIVYAVRWISHSGTAQSTAALDNPLEILKKRYARGESDRDEFMARKQEIA